MSYILDALRKSEQERMRGKLPDLNHFGEEDKRASSSHRWMWIVGGAVLTVNVIAVGIWLSRSAPVEVATQAEQEKPATPAVAQTPAAASSAAPVEQQKTTPGTSPVTTPVTTAAAANIQEAPTVATTAATAAPVTAQAVAPGGPGQTGAVTVAPQANAPAGTVYYVTPGTPVPGQQIVVLPAGSVVPGAVAPGGNVVVQMPAQPTWPTQATAVQPPPPVPPPPVPVNLDQALDATGAAAPTPEVGYLPTLEELPEYLRAQIPDMTFSSHMYSSMQRFRSVVINGTRVKEGQMVTNNIQVNEITETGVILSVGGTLFQVDVLGKWSQ